jgi:tRNA (guanine-N7-)-methyltransferase
MTARIPQHSALTLPWSTDWTQIFGNTRPLIVEIGFGTGTFLQFLAKKYPEHNLIGLEISNQCLAKAEKMIQREGFTHVRVVHARAETALHHLFEPGSVEQFYINFPDPWFKTSHHRRRLMQHDTVDALVSRLATGGALYLATDILDYAELAADLLEHTPQLDNQLSTRWGNKLPGRITTKYEAKAQREGRPCYYFAYQRNSTPAPNIPVLKELTMPHVVLYTPLSIDDMRSKFQPFDAHDGDIVIGFNEVYRGRNALLFEIYAHEPTIDQHTALLLTPHMNNAVGEFTLQMTTLGHTRATAGIHLATRALSEWLVSLSSDARILNQKISKAEDDG